MKALAGARPVVHVTVPADALTDGNVLGVLERAGIPHVALAATQPAQATCDATLTPWMITRTGAVQAQLPRVRAIHPAMRRAITVRDAHCRFPGRWARIDEIHHLIYWRHGGETRRSNLVELCWHHHHPAHQHRHIAGNPETTLTFTNTRARHHYASDPPRWN
ncbi:MAG: HNH endonuclease [Miltoncostaeaceae bacterium]